MNSNYFEKKKAKLLSSFKEKKYDNCLFATGGNNIEQVKFKKNATLRRTGSAALDMAYVAAGKFDGYFQKNLKIWDIASGIILIKEAGGIINDIDVNKYEIEKVLASSVEINGKLIENLINF